MDFVKERLDVTPDMNSRDKCQRIGKYEFIIMQSRMVPLAVERGVLTGITGYDWLYDYTLGKPNTNLRVIEKLSFGRAQVVVFKDKSTQIKNSPTVLSPYMNLAREYIDKQFEDAQLVYAAGETEGMVKNGTAAQLGVDNKNSGKTLKSTRLKIIDKLLDSYALTISKESDIDTVRKIWGLL